MPVGTIANVGDDASPQTLPATLLRLAAGGGEFPDLATPNDLLPEFIELPYLTRRRAVRAFVELIGQPGHDITLRAPHLSIGQRKDLSDPAAFEGFHIRNFVNDVGEVRSLFVEAVEDWDRRYGTDSCIALGAPTDSVEITATLDAAAEIIRASSVRRWWFDHSSAVGFLGQDPGSVQTRKLVEAVEHGGSGKIVYGEAPGGAAGTPRDNDDALAFWGFGDRGLIGKPPTWENFFAFRDEMPQNAVVLLLADSDFRLPLALPAADGNYGSLADLDLNRERTDAYLEVNGFTHLAVGRDKRTWGLGTIAAFPAAAEPAAAAASPATIGERLGMIDDLLDTVTAEEFGHTITVTPRAAIGSTNRSTGARAPGAAVNVPASPPLVAAQPGAAAGGGMVEIAYEVRVSDWIAAGLPDPRAGGVLGFSVRGADGTDEGDLIDREIVRCEQIAGGGLARIKCRGRL